MRYALCDMQESVLLPLVLTGKEEKKEKKMRQRRGIFEPTKITSADLRSIRLGLVHMG